MSTTRVHALFVCSTLAVLSARSAASPTRPTPTPPTDFRLTTLTLVQGRTAAVTGTPLRLGFDAIVIRRGLEL
jgi:hypothetical protein